MKVSLTINGLSLGPYIKEEGIQVSPFFRNETSIITLDGTLHKSGVIKKKIKVDLLEMPDDEFLAVSTYLATNPATVAYTDLDTGTTSTSTYYISDLSHTAKKAITGLTVVSGASFTLEEK